MNCSRCFSKYDQEKYVPKLLVMCGHTLCEKCCSQLFKNGRIECFQCRTNTFTDRISSLPKNLALIPQKNNLPKQCSKHLKKYQAFCSNQKSLICIQCILQDGHKNHQMNSISKAFQIQSANFSTKIQKIQSHLKLLQQKFQQNQKNQSQSYKNYTIINQVAKETFQTVRKLIDEHEQSLSKEMENIFKTSDEKFSDKNQLYFNKKQELNHALMSANAFQCFSQTDFLDNLREKQIEINLIKLNNYENPKILTFQHSKSSILQSCIKILTNQKNPPQRLSSYSSNNSQTLATIPPKSQKPAFVEPLRGFKKAAFSNVTNCQNNKPQKKVSARKQSITHHVQTPFVKTIDREKVLKVSNNITATVSCGDSGKKKTIKKIEVLDYLSSDISSVDPRESLCNSFMSNMTTFMTENRSVYILGGFNQQNNSIVKLDLMSMSYQQVTTLNNNRSKFGAVFADRKLYVFGGKRGKERLSDIEMYDFDKNSWFKVGNMSKSKSGFGIALMQDEVYLIGGNDGQNILNTVETFNIKTKEWKKHQSMSEPRDELSIIVGNDDKIYAIGGFGGSNNEPLKSVQCFDIKTKQWKQLAKMKYARRALSSAVLADGIYAIGGFDGNSYMSSVQKYDTTNNQWTQTSSMNVARCTHSSIAIYQTQEIYVFGGFDFLPLSSVQKYSLISNQWEKIIDMPAARFMHSSVFVKSGSMY